MDPQSCSCGDIFYHDTSADVHIKLHLPNCSKDNQWNGVTNAASVADAEVSSSHTLAQSGIHYCQHCTRVYVKASTMAKHLKEKHGVKKPWKCDVCNERFPDKVTAQFHLQTQHDIYNIGVIKEKRRATISTQTEVSRTAVPRIQQPQDKQMSSSGREERVSFKRELSPSDHLNSLKRGAPQSTQTEVSRTAKPGIQQPQDVQISSSERKEHVSFIRDLSPSDHLYSRNEPITQRPEHSSHQQQKGDSPLTCKEGFHRTLHESQNQGKDNGEEINKNKGDKGKRKRGDGKDAAQDEDKPYPCTECGKRFQRNYTMLCHLRIHKQGQANGTSNETEQDNETRAFSCKECDESFVHYYILKRHLQTVHPDAAQRNKNEKNKQRALDRPFPCSKCGKWFHSTYNLKRHLKVHEEKREKPARPFSCPKCGDTFSTKSNLKSHLRSFHVEEYKKLERTEEEEMNDRPLSCGKCGNRFNSRSNLRRHLQLVHDILVDNFGHEVSQYNSLFSCNDCEKSFDLADDWEKHCEEAHGADKEVHKCDSCGNDFIGKHRFQHHRYKCSCIECGECFQEPASLFIHSSVSHPKDTWPCALEESSLHCKLKRVILTLSKGSFF